MSKRVVVTGMGRVTPLGLDLPTTWQAMLEGKSGTAPIQGFDTTEHEVKIAAEIPTFDPTKIMNAKEARRIDRFIELGMYAAREAWQHAGMAVTDENAERIGAILLWARRHREPGQRLQDALRQRPGSCHTVPDRADADRPAAGHDLDWILGSKARISRVSSPCASLGTRWVSRPRSFAAARPTSMIAGGGDAGRVPIGLAAFDAMRALSTRNDDPPARQPPI